MVGTILVIADYLPVLNRTRAALGQAGYRVLTSTNVATTYPLARLYLPDAVVLLYRLGTVRTAQAALDALAADATTHTIPVVLLGDSPTPLPDSGQRGLTLADAFDAAGLLHTLAETLPAGRRPLPYGDFPPVSTPATA